MRTVTSQVTSPAAGGMSGVKARAMPCCAGGVAGHSRPYWLLHPAARPVLWTHATEKFRRPHPTTILIGSSTNQSLLSHCLPAAVSRVVQASNLVHKSLGADQHPCLPPQPGAALEPAWQVCGPSEAIRPRSCIAAACSVCLVVQLACMGWGLPAVASSTTPVTLSYTVPVYSQQQQQQQQALQVPDFQGTASSGNGFPGIMASSGDASSGMVSLLYVTSSPATELQSGGGATPASPAFCQPAELSAALRRFANDPASGDGFDGGSSVPGLIAYYKRLGCTASELDAGVRAAYQDFMPGALLIDGPTRDDEPPLLTWEIVAPYLQQLAVAGVTALVICCWQDRPLGWVANELVEARPSGVAGTGLFAKVVIPADTRLGAYPGRVRTVGEMRRKFEYAPQAASYAFLTPTADVYLDPTDASGTPSAWPGPGWPWPRPTPTQLAMANEPPAGGKGTNCYVIDGEAEHEVLFVTSRMIAPGEELFIDYGVNYDRSDYR